MTFKIIPYKQGSRSAKALATELEGHVLKLEGSRYKTYRQGDVLVNWGRSDWADIDITVPEGVVSVILNSPILIGQVSNKLAFFDLMKVNCPNLIPEFWTNKEEIPDDKFPIVCRTILSGHSGAGIVIADCRDDLVDAPLYVRYIKKKDEYRIHVGKKWVDYGVGCAVSLGVEGEWVETTIAVQRKARRIEVPNEEVNWRIRNLSGGFVFKREGVVAPPACIEAACDSLRATGLDFGAVDVIWNEQQGKAYVLEINTAPGLEGQTVTDYANFFKGFIVYPPS